MIGVAGASGEKNNTNKRVIYSNLTHGANKKDAGVKIDALQEVQTVDECFFVVKIVSTFSISSYNFSNCRYILIL